MTAINATPSAIEPELNETPETAKKERTKKIPPPMPEPELHHAPQMAAIVNIPVRSFHQYAQQGLIPSFKIGKHRLFRKSEVFSALEKLRTASLQEVLQ
jgi:hypothetical protein